MLLWLMPSILLIVLVEVMAGLLLSLNLQIEQAVCRLIAPCITFLCLMIFADIWGEISLAISFTVANFVVMSLSLMYLRNAKIRITNITTERKTVFRRRFEKGNFSRSI
jgi:O-antigen/teichoic acid export membrane protein